MQLFYHHTIDEFSTECTFDAVESQHIVRVLRKREGDIMEITDGKGAVFQGEIVQAHDKRCKVKIVSKEIHPKSRNFSLQIAIAPTKNMDRLEWFAEKATEIGVDMIIPIICDHSERKILKTDRLEKVVIAALKQSGQFYLPKITEPVRFEDFIKESFSGKRCIAHCVETERHSLKEVVKADENIQIMIGPEGDFSEKEIQLALQQKCIPVTLGNTRLRTETAGVVAVHTVILMNE